MAVALFLTTTAAGQEAVKWEKPPETLMVDFASPKTPVRTVFAEEGAGYEFSSNFVLVGREKVTLIVRLPEPGRPEVTLTSPAALVEFKEIRNSPQEVAYEIRAKIPLKREALTAQAHRQAREALAAQERDAAREAKGKEKQALQSYLARRGVTGLPDDVGRLQDRYAQERAIEGGADVLRAKLNDFADQHPAWFLESERKAWKDASGKQLMTLYRKLLELELGKAYLKNFGLELDTSKRSGLTLLGSKLEGVNALLSGATLDSNSDARRALRGLAPEDLEQIRQAVTVTTRCRFYFAADPADENSQWFHAQRVACQARGASSIQVEGRLDPVNHDPTDWWILEDYDPSRVTIVFPKDEDIRHELFTAAGGAKLRLTALGGKAVSYTLEFRSKGPAPSQRTLIVHEYAAPREAKFPF